MAAGDWNFLAGRLVGDGTIEIIETELPIDISGIDRNLSTPSTMSGTITNRVSRLMNNGRPILEPGSSVIIAEASNLIRGMAIYRRPTFTGEVWDLDLIGLSGYPIGMPYTGSISWSSVDPLDVFRHAWDHLQAQPNGNIGVTLDRTATSPVRVGGTGDSSSDNPPRTLNWWDTEDLGGVIDSYSRETPFDWVEDVFWDGDQPRCHIDLAYPTIGGRSEDLGLVLGMNMATTPTLVGIEYFNECQVLGAGEGRARVRGQAGVTDGRLRQVKTVTDEKVTTVAQANARATEELTRLRGGLAIDQVDVYDHPNVPLEALTLGLEVPVVAETDHMVVDQYARIVGKSQSPQNSDRATLTLVRSVIL